MCSSDLKDHFFNFLIYIIFIVLIVNYVATSKEYLGFLQSTYIAFCLFMYWTALTHLSDFVNPLYYPIVLVNGSRIRAGFGMDYNMAGNIFACSIVLSLILRSEMQQDKSKLWFWGWLVNDIVFIMMLFSTASRTSILGVIAFIFFWYFINPKVCVSTIKSIFGLRCKTKLGEKQIRNISIILIIIFSIGIIIGGNIESILAGSNRAENWSVNYPIFRENASLWTGLGYVESSAFLIRSYGYPTWPVDNYYFYIFFSSGLLGFSIMALVLIAIFYGIIKSEKRRDSGYLAALYIMLLISGSGEVNLITYRFFSSTIYMSILLANIATDFE